MLDIGTLAKRAFEYLESSVLSPESAAKLLYTAVQLHSQGGGGGAFESVCGQVTDVLRRGFGTAFSSPDGLRLLCQLPLDVLGKKPQPKPHKDRRTLRYV